MQASSFALLAITLLLVEPAAANGGGPNKAPDEFEGTLRVHPRFWYRYYIDNLGSGQKCALFGSDKSLSKIPVGSYVRVQGDLASRYFGYDPKDKSPHQLAEAWIIYMNVTSVQVMRKPEPPSDREHHGEQAHKQR